MTRNSPKPRGVVTDQDMAAVIRAALPKAKNGDMTAALLIERLWRTRDRTITLDLPATVDAKSVAEAQVQVLAAVAGNRITPRVGRDVSAIIENRRRALETIEYEERLNEIEANQAQADTLREQFRERLPEDSRK